MVDINHKIGYDCGVCPVTVRSRSYKDICKLEIYPCSNKIGRLR